MFVLPNESTAIPPSGLYWHPNCLPKSDACIGWEATVQVLDILREGVRARRARNNQNGSLAYNE